MNEAPADLTIAEDGPHAVIVFTGRLDAAGAGAIWDKAVDEARAAQGRPLWLDVSSVTLIDTAGAAFLGEMRKAHGDGVTEVKGADPRFQSLIDRVAATPAPSDVPVRPAPSLREIAMAGLRAAANGIAFIGETAVATTRIPANHRMLPTRDLLRYADQAGVRSLPLVLLLGFLIGLILAFQSAVPMRRFGADLYVANLVSVSLLRELGPLLAAVILAGRTGSAYAAEIGTMKVNEEIDALVTMGLDPMTMLVLPRLMAAMLVMPAMTLVLDISGLLGMTVVMRGFGFPFVTIANQVARATTVMDLIQGLVKALCFGAVVAAIGCREGLGTGVGPRAVGLSATGAVVGGIVATIVLDGLFALVLYRVGL